MILNKEIHPSELKLKMAMSRFEGDAKIYVNFLFKLNLACDPYGICNSRLSERSCRPF